METHCKNCESCGKPLRGRTDKRFCNDYCRHLYHNKNRAGDEDLVRIINRTLKRNRQILKEILEPSCDPVTINREDLLDKGFVFRYHTHEKRGRQGSVYKFCYEYGHLSLENEKCLIIKEE